MYRKGDKTVSIEEAASTAEAIGMSIEEWANKYGWTLEGKQKGSTETTPTEEPISTPAGDSSSGDISLESPEIDFSITADDLKADEGEVVAALNAKLSQYGLIAKESTGVGSFNAINIEKRKTKQDEKGFLEIIGSAPEAIFKAGYDFFTSFNVGADLSQKELEENAAAINKLVKEMADPSYLSKAQEQLGDKWNQFKEAVTPEDKTDEELAKEYKAGRLDKFEEIRAKYNKINANKFRAAGANQNVKIEEPTIEEFANDEEYNAYLAWQNGDLINDPTKEDLLKFDLERRRAFEDAKSQEFGSDLSISEKQALDALVDNKVKVLEKDIKNFNNLRDKGELIVNRANDVIEQYNSNPTLDNFDIATAAIKEAREVETAILDNAKALQESLGEKEYIDLAINVLKKDYSRLRQMRNVAKGMAADVWLLGAELDEIMGISYEGEYEKAIALKREVMRESEGFQRNLTIDEVSSAKDAGRWIAGAATNLLPSLGLSATGSAALPLFFMTGSGGKLGEMAVAEQDAAMRLAKNAKYLEDNPDIDEIERAAIEAEMAKDAKTLNISDLKKYGVASLYGAAEVIFEKVGTQHILKNLGKTAKTLKPTNIKEGFAAVGKTWGQGLYREGGSEWATTITQNIGDIFILEEDKNVFEGALESFAQGGLMGVSMVSINTPRLVREAVVSELATREESKRLKEIMKRISELTNTPVSNIDLGALGRFGALTPEVRKMVEELTLEQGTIKDQILEGLGTKYNVQDLFKIGEHNRKLRKIESEWAQIASNPNYSPSQLAALEAEYRNKYNAEAEARDQVLENEESIAENLKDANTRSVSFDATQGYAMYSARMQTESLLRINAEFDNIGATQKQSLNDAAKAELEKEGVEVTNDSVKNRARKNYVDGKYRELIEKGRDNVLAYIKANKGKGITPPESFDGDNATADLIARAEALGYENIERLKKDLENGVTEGLNWNGNKLIHIPNSIENRRIGVFAHEVLHDEAAIGIQSKEGNAAGQLLLDYLEKNQPDLFAQVKDRLDKNYIETDGETGEARKNKYYQEEALTALSDLLADGYIPSGNVMEQMKLFLSKILPKWAKLSTDAAVYQFVLDYNKAAHFGGKVKQRNPFVRAVGKEPEDKEGKQSRTASAERAKEALDKMQEEGYDPNNFELYDILNGMAGAQLNKYKVKGLQITDMEEAVADVVGRLYTERDVNKFDGRGSLYGYLNGRIKFRILDAFKANPIWVEDFGDVDAEGLTGKEVQKVAVEAVETTEAPKAEEGYKNLLRRRVLEPEVVDAIKAKVMSTVRVMKTRMDESVSKNVTVKPYIAELRKTMGKQADIDLKKAMGGLKDGQLRKFLLKNKAAILENMTTTWLMTAMPNAVQKKVDGQWTSDWKGKKIDRETVATDSAGRTSGAELVRRLPKAATRMSDADFLSNFFNADGSLIRGRKESLAKAMAEEISFDIINEALQDPNSEIRKAFEMRQDLLGVELADNFVAEVSRDIERGNVKYSKTLAKAANQNSSLLGQFGEVIKSEDFKAVVRAYSDNRNFMSKSLVEYFKVNPNKLEELGLTLKDVKVIGMEINQNFSAEIKEANKIAEETAALSIRAELNDHLNNLMIDINDQVFSRDVESMLASAGINIPDVATYGGRVRAMQSLESINKGRGAVKYLVEKLGNKIFYLKGGLASPARLGGFVHAQDKSTFDGLYIKEGEVKESGRSVRFGLFLSSADFDSSLGLDGANAPNTSSLTTTKGFIQGRKWDNATLEQRKELAKAEYKQAEELKDVLIETVEVLKEGYENGDLSAEQVVMVISTIFSDAAMNSLGKASAGLRWFVVNENGDLATMQDMVNEGIAYKPGDQRLLGNNKTPKDPFVLEHTIPNRSMALRSMDLIFNNKGRAEFFAELENYNTAIIPQKVDDQVALNGFKDSMPLSHKPGDMPLKTRYKGTGLKFYDAKTGEIVGTGIQHNVREHQDAIEAMEPQTKYSQSVPRAVFMVGGPGAGKTNVGKGLKLGRRGYKVINQDLALEPMKEEAGLPANEQEYTKEQRSMRAKLGAAARKAAEAKMEKYLGLRESMVVDGTGASYNATMKKINALRKAGYEVSIVFANTSKDEAIARNKARAERALPDMIVERTWEAVQESAKLYKEEFGDKFYELNTNELKLGEDLPKPFLDKLYKDLEVGEAKYSKSVSREFNEILERKTGVASYKEFSRIQAQLRGKKKGRFKFFIHPSADDFRGLVHYAFAGKGKQGEADIAWLEEKLLTPYFRGVAAIDAMRQQIKRDFKVVTKQFREEYKLLGKQVGNSGFTYDHALRVYMWDRQGMPIEGLAKRDKTLLLDAIAKNPELVELADALLVVSRRNEWPEPTEYWEGGSILGDLNGMTEKIGRKKFLAEFIENAEIIFSEENLNKIEALFGSAHREAIEDSLYSMKNGTNRRAGTSKQVGAWLNWVNGSTGAIMFFNRRSALLQMLSFTNFINWSDNNPAMAAAAFANQKQYWKDWAMIFNSDKLKERRGGLKQDVSDAELAAVATRSKNSPQAILAYLLKIGFTPTQIADSMAIATGGAMFYRNRVNTYLKQGMDQAAAEEQAFLDFSKKSDEAQQSSDPALVSQQQRSVLGRMILAFANTPMQYTRLMKKAGQDLINGRGNPLENISKIAYYGVIQNFIFSALQSAMFALLFDDDEEDDEKKAAEQEKRTVRTLNSMLDTVLRGSGIYGAVASTVKNTIMEFYRQEDKGFLADHTYTLLSALNLSPPIGSKARKLYSAIQTRKFEKDNIEQRGWSLTADGRLNIGPNYFILGNVLSGVTNVPMDRVADELNSITEALDARNKSWQRIALALGWKTWDVGARNEEADLIKAAGKEKRKQEGIEKAKETRKETKKRKDEAEAAEREKLRRMTPAQRAAYLRNKKK